MGTGLQKKQNKTQAAVVSIVKNFFFVSGTHVGRQAGMRQGASTNNIQGFSFKGTPLYCY